MVCSKCALDKPDTCFRGKHKQFMNKPELFERIKKYCG